MIKILDDLGKEVVKRYTLSFKDADLEKVYLKEYNNKLLHLLIWVNTVIIILLFINMIIRIAIQQDYAIVRIWFPIIFLLLAIIASCLYLSPGPHLNQTLLGIILPIIISYFAYTQFMAASGDVVIGIMQIVSFMFILATIPFRFAFAIPAYILMIVFSGLILYISKSVEIIQFIKICAFFAMISIICLLGLYQREKIERINFYQRFDLEKQKQKITEYSEFLKKMFGRYLSTEVMNTLIENPSSLDLGGEKREVTIMMTDLRGFVALTERLKPEKLVEMLNAYFEVMVDIVFKYNGTINEIIGDALLVIFGAPQEMPDRAERAIACAIDMQNAMSNVNAKNRDNALPELEMGIGLNEAEVIIGNIGSSKRSKYTVVGSGVNLTSRIESYTVGGQILISESVKNKVGEKIRIDNQMEVMPKGAETPLKLFEVGGISGDYHLMLTDKDYDLATLLHQIPVLCKIIDGKHVGKSDIKAVIKRLSKIGAEIVTVEPLERLSNLKVNLEGVNDNLNSKDLYAKVIEDHKENSYFLRFTSVPEGIAAYFQAYRDHRL